MLFSDWQATTQALQPKQEPRSTESPQAFSLYSQPGWKSDASFGGRPCPFAFAGSFTYSGSDITRTISRPSIRKCCCVCASGERAPVFASVTPATIQGAAVVRSGVTSTPTPLPTRPAWARPKPRWSVTTPAAWPGWMRTGSSTLFPFAVTFTTSSFCRPSFCAVAGETIAALSHVSLLSGFGSSWSQPLLAKRPSRRDGSGRKTASRSEGLAAAEIVAAASACATSATRTGSTFAGNAVPGTTPS